MWSLEGECYSVHELAEMLGVSQERIIETFGSSHSKHMVAKAAVPGKIRSMLNA